MSDDDRLDRALSRLHETDIEYATARIDGLSNHGPMAAESLIALGGGERVERFVEAYARRLRPLPDGTRAMVDDYRARLSDRPLSTIVPALLDELLPAAVSAAAHGWLRTAHALRALRARDNDVRRRELAFGLSSWKSSFQRVPGVPGRRAQKGLDVVAALARVPFLAASLRTDDGLIVDRVRAAETLDGFAEAIEAVDLDAMPIDDAIGALAAAGARLFVATPDERFVYLHTITASSALRMLDGVVDEGARRRALAGVFHAVAALHATHGDPLVSHAAISGAFPIEAPPSADAIRARALQSDDDHDLKLADAVLREDARSHRPELLMAGAIRLKIRS